MGNPIQEKSSFERCLVQGCCFCMTLRNGTLAIAIVQLIMGILWFVSSGTGGSGGGSLTGIVGAILNIIVGVLLCLGVKKESSRFLWWCVYLMIGIGIWMVIYIIIAFVSLFWVGAIYGIINFLVLLYFTSVVRSYAFEVEGAPSTVAPA